MQYILFALFCAAIMFVSNRFMRRMTDKFIKEIQEATKQACDELNRLLQDD